MISGTGFRIDEPWMVARSCLSVARGRLSQILSVSEIAEIQAECEARRAMCLTCEDGMIVIDLRSSAEGLELFVWLAVAFKHGLYSRQDAALDKIGRDLGARTVAFHSRRRGWGRRLGPEWSRRGSDEFVREVR